jgi:hypothetical protein
VGKYTKEDTSKLVSYLTKNNINNIQDDMPTFNKNFVVYKEELLNRRECRS